ncbi:hypothetical protein C6N75_09905 [Streptomyces solincola]|uniref:Uncharacterized protein n=1 Tax=Streptomyces solincola TaxID=2100817 RepID=A0A2S9PYH3_9ACTN|nr:hypothetical protein [Streptomyces solincola]PRH79387.1 hypothetical protein C6N75_09905 [Streptomyces solincola]
MSVRVYAQKQRTTERARRESYEVQDSALDELIADAVKVSRKARRLSAQAEAFLIELQDDRL